MKRLQLYVSLACCLLFREARNTPSPRQNSTYVISVSEVLQCGVPTALSITTLTQHLLNVSAQILHGPSVMSGAHTSVPAGSTRRLTLPPVFYDETSFWFPYELLVKGFVGDDLLFSNSTVLIFSPTCTSIFIQTDKSHYRPGQAVKFRVVSLTPDGKPYSGQIDVYVKDPKGNLIRQWLSVDAFHGVVSRELNLSQNPPLGLWKISARIRLNAEEREFLVENYVPPRFEVKVKVPPLLHFEDTLQGRVTATYFSGKPVSGKMSVSFFHGFHGLEKPVEQNQTIQGSADITYHLPDECKPSGEFMPPFERPGDHINLTVTVTESLTGLTYSSSRTIPVLMNKYSLVFLRQSQTIKPCTNFTAQLKLSSFDQRPLTVGELSKSVTLTITQHTFSPDSQDGSLDPQTLNTTSTTSEIKIPVTENGIIPFQVHLLDNIATLEIEAQFEDSTTHLLLHSSYFSSSNSYIQLHSDSEPLIGHPVSFTVEANVPLTTFHYLVTSGGQVVDAGTLSSSSFNLTADQSWAPSAHVLVFHSLPSGDILQDAVSVRFKNVPRNTVSLSWSRNRTEPGLSVNLSVSVSEPGSLVGILVVEKGNQDCWTDNGFTENTAMDEFMPFTHEKSQPDLSGMGMGDPDSIFEMCGVKVLTDGIVSREADGFLPAIPWDRPGPPSHPRQPRDGQHFPESWLWLEVNVSESTSFSVTVPDRLTSWVASAFVMSESLGLGIGAPAELRVFKDFHLSLNLPTFLIRGELLLLEVNLFNSINVDLEVTVEVTESHMFQFVSPDSSGHLAKVNVRKVWVLRENVTSILFPIRATVLGEIPFSVTATCDMASDHIYRTILVKPEGAEQSFTQTLFLDFSLKTTLRKMSFSFPADVVPGSQRATVSASGNILGPSIGRLDSLVQLPYGCGEQNMVHLAPSIYVLQYLRSSQQQQQQQEEESTRSRAMSFMMEAYERELSYQRSDGSFSAFGDSDVSGSTWLSAFVLRCLLQARSFFSVDPSVMQRASAWLVTQQKPDGSFQEAGRVIHPELRGGLDGALSLTAYVLAALLEDEDTLRACQDSVSSALGFLASGLSAGVSSDYSLSLLTYAMSLANSSSAPAALREMMSRAHLIDGVPRWSSAGKVSHSAQIEMSAYVLLSLHRQTLMEEGFALMKWLCLQRNHLGGFGSTQDTVMALQALSVFAVFSGTETLDLTVTVSDASSTLATFSINPSTYLLLQSRELPVKPGKDIDLQIRSKGKGFALLQLSVFYNLNPQSRRSLADEAFALSVEVTDEDELRGNLRSCFRLKEHQGLNQTGMAILDVGLLSGFSLEPERLHTDQTLRRIETPSGRVILYLDSVTLSETCVNIPTVQDFRVTGVRDAVITIYDYYEPQRKTLRSYTSGVRRDMSMCSLCGAECSGCGLQEASTPEKKPTSGNHTLPTPSCVLLLIILIIFS